MAATAKQRLSPTLGIRMVRIIESEAIRSLPQQAGGALEGGFQESTLAQKVLRLGGVTG
jgi:hypothetical protein